MSPSPSRTVFVALVANIGVVEHDFLLPMSARHWALRMAVPLE